MEQIILFSTLALFPFGQIIRIGIIQPLDIVVGIGAIRAIFNKVKKPDWFKYFDNFLILAATSWIFSVFYFWDIKLLYGFLYLIRLFAYFYFALLVNHYVNSLKLRALFLNSLLALSLVSSLFGWIQFFKFPDLKPFFTYGWDEHLYRLVGTFLDPTFLGVILVFGALIAFSKKYYLAFAFLVFSILFTYSRASYLALFAGLTYLAYQQKLMRKIFFIFLSFIFLAFLLPTSRNHSIEILRKFSAVARIENYNNTLNLFKKSPVFGIGYNNLCFVKNIYQSPESYLSHACSGSDSSLLFVLATTGILGIIVFLELFVKMWKKSRILFKSVLVALLIHSLFSNSLFYSWVLIYFWIVYVVDFKE